MKKQHYKRFILSLFALFQWGIITAGWGFVWYNEFSEKILRPFGYKGNWLIITVYGILLFIFSNVYSAYRVGYYKRGDVIFSGCLAVFFTNAITYLQISLISRRFVSLRSFALFTLGAFIVVWIWSKMAGSVYFKLYPPHQMLIISGEDISAETLIRKMHSRSEKYEVCETISITAGLDAIYRRIEEYNVVIICDVKSELRNKILKHCYANSVRVYLTPKISDTIIRGAEDIHLFDTPLMLCRNYGLTFEQRFFKRLLDILIIVPVTLIFSPFILITALAIKLYDKGPVIYKQKRYTINGKIFEVYKFRSMIVDAEKVNGVQLTSVNDNRITPVGKVIRKLRLDELPQLLNIIKGDMSIVGPRPEWIEVVREYEELMPEFSFRLKVKGGLTGYAQVMGKYNTTPYDKLKLDLMYIENYSLLQDIKLILMTIKTVFQSDSTEGFEEGQSTATAPERKTKR